MITNEEAASLLSSNANTDYGGTSRLTELGPITPVTVAWHNVIVTTKKGGRLVLDSISGLAQSGHLTALMGARWVFLFLVVRRGKLFLQD